MVATYPINWEIDSTNTTHGQAGRHMYVYSTDMHLKDRVFLTRLDYEIPGSISPPQTNYGDSIYAINPGATSLPIYLYFSDDNGITWTQVSGTNLSPGSIWRYGGVGSSTAMAGEYMVVSPDGDVMVHKGTSLANPASYDEKAVGMAVADAGKGQKVATAPANFYAAVQNNCSGLAITNVGASPVTYNIQRYVDTVTGAWPISSSNGTWSANLVTGATVAVGATALYNATPANFYRVQVTAGTAQVQSGGRMTYHSNGGDGDSYEGVNNSSADWLASGGTTHAGRDNKFYVTQNFNDEGRIDIIAPVAGTILTRGVGTAGAWLAAATDPNPWPASTGGVDRGYQALIQYGRAQIHHDALARAYGVL